MTYGEFRALWDSLTEPQRERIRDKARWEAMSLWAVVNEWPSLVAQGGDE